MITNDGIYHGWWCEIHWDVSPLNFMGDGECWFANLNSSHILLWQLVMAKLHIVYYDWPWATTMILGSIIDKRTCQQTSIPGRHSSHIFHHIAKAKHFRTNLISDEWILWMISVMPGCWLGEEITLVLCRCWTDILHVFLFMMINLCISALDLSPWAALTAYSIHALWYISRSTMHEMHSDAIMWVFIARHRIFYLITLPPFHSRDIDKPDVLHPRGTLLHIRGLLSPLEYPFLMHILLLRCRTSPDIHIQAIHIYTLSSPSILHYVSVSSQYVANLSRRQGNVAYPSRYGRQ